MIKKPSNLAAARAALEKAEEDLGNPGRLGVLRNAINILLQMRSGVAPQIEKDIAKKLVLRSKNKVLSEVKVILSNCDSYEPGSLEHWNKLMEVFVNASLADDPEFNACKELLLTRCNNQPTDILKAVDIRQTERQAACPQNDLQSGIIYDVRTMLHATSLKDFGQSLDILRLRAFSLEKKGDFYIVRSDSLTADDHWILRNKLAEINLDSREPDGESTQLTVGDGWLCYGPLDIARLNAQERNKRDNPGFDQTREADNLAPLLGTLGEHLDSNNATAFKISWVLDSVSVDYETPAGVHERKELTVKKLQQLALYSGFQKSTLLD